MEINDTLILLSLTQTEIDAITSPTEGGLLYNSTTNSIQVYDGTGWDNTSISDTDDLPEGSVNLYARRASSISSLIFSPATCPEQCWWIYCRVRPNIQFIPKGSKIVNRKCLPWVYPQSLPPVRAYLLWSLPAAAGLPSGVLTCFSAEGRGWQSSFFVIPTEA